MVSVAANRPLPLIVWRCEKCGHRLGDVVLEGRSCVQIVCPKCKTMNERKAA